ncbi:MAG: hypothetical protein K6C95_05310 [Lachnospiraceae bacterium]|nr:hypothetical protein [Lachnospiraceae bacterium]
MTSANSSLGKFIREQREITARRLPLAALSVLMYFLYDIFGTAMAIQRERASIYIDTDDAVLTFAARGARIVSSWMGFRGIGWFICVVGAILLGIQGFAYLYKTSTVDFYLSRPEKRSTRFCAITVNNFLIYALPSLLGTLLAFLLTVLNGCAAGWLFSEMLLAWLCQTVMFLAILAMSTAASLLTGTVVTAVLMNAFFFGIEALFRLTVYFHMSAYFRTFDDSGDQPIINRFLLLPPYHYLKSITGSPAYSITDSSYGYANMLQIAKDALPGVLFNLIIFAVFIVIAFYLYRTRKAEHAGLSVTHRAVCVFIKFSAAILFSLDAGLFVYWIFGRKSASELVAVILTILVTIFVGCALLETIFAQNIRDAFHRFYQVPVIAVITLIVMFAFRLDITGYDRWLPDASQVESAWLVNYNYNLEDVDEFGSYISQNSLIKKRMFLTNTEDVRELARIGQEMRCRYDDNSYNEFPDDQAYYWNAIVGWRMKNGKIVTRSIDIPENIDPALMDRIVKTKEFQDGVYRLENADTIRESAKRISGASRFNLYVNTEHGVSTGSDSMLDEFLKVYAGDVHNHYSFTMASANAPVGCVEYRVSDNGWRNRYYGISWPVYESYTDTIAFLDRNGLWCGGFITPEEVARVEILRSVWDEDGEYSENLFTSDDTAQIREIMDASMSTTYTSAWYRYGSTSCLDESNVTYDINVYAKRGIIYNDSDDDSYAGDEACFGRVFLNDRIPSYVKDRS